MSKQQSPKIDIQAMLREAKEKAKGTTQKSITDIGSTIQAALNYSPEADPLAEVEYGQGIEKDCENETSALLQGFRDRAQKEQERFVTATDSEFWFAISFHNRDQKEAFLQAMGWLTIGDKYIDGTQLAKQLGIELPVVDLANKRAKPDKRLQPLVKKE